MGVNDGHHARLRGLPPPRNHAWAARAGQRAGQASLAPRYRLRRRSSVAPPAPLGELFYDWIMVPLSLDRGMLDLYECAAVNGVFQAEPGRTGLPR